MSSKTVGSVETVGSFVKHINAMRRQGGWYQFVGSVAGKHIEIKGYGTWIQVYRVDGVRYAGLHDRSVKQFTNDLLEPWA